MNVSSMPHRESGARPASVGTAVKLLYAALGLGVILFLIDLLTDRLMIPKNIADGRWPEWVLFGAIGLIVVGVVFLLITWIGSGKNWVRMVFLVLFILGVLSLPLSVKPLIQSFSQAPAPAIVGLVQLVMQGLAIILLFRKDSSAWFKTMKRARADFSMHR